jgi:quercetin dioxygenase-like cupin family protein
MRRCLAPSIRLFAALAAALMCGAAGGTPAQDRPDPPKRVVATPDELVWRDVPVGGPGTQVAILAGDPSREGAPFVMRLRLPDGHVVPPHRHPVDENVTVLSGALYVGVGEKFDREKARRLPAGSFSLMPRGTPHFLWAEGETIIQSHGVGPFDVTYVGAAEIRKLADE